MWSLFIGIVASYQVDFSSTIVFYSTNTPPGLLLEFSQFSNQIKLLLDLKSLNIFLAQNSIFIDLTLNTGFLPLLDIIAENCQGSYITLSPQENGLSSKRRIQALNNSTSESEALTKMIKFLNFNQFTLMSSSSFYSLKLSRMVFENNKEKIFEFITYSESIKLGVANSLVQKMIKSAGISKILIVGETDNLDVIQNSLVQKRMNDTGAVFLFTSSATGSIFIEGSLIISEEGTENSTSHYNYFYNAIMTKISKTRFFQSHFPILQETFSIINIQESASVTVGSISGSLTIKSPILYPGSTYSPSEFNLKQITLLIANGTVEIYNSFNYNLFSYFYNGAVYAVNQMNTLNEIPNFQFNLRKFDTGLFLYEENWYKQKLSEALVSPKPIAILTNFWPVAAIGTSITLRTMNIQLPQISPFAQAPEAESKENFPYLLKLSVSQIEFLSNAINFLMSFGWRSIVLLATDDDTFYPYYLAIVELAKARGITIVNSEDKRIFPSNYTRDDYEQYISYFKEVKDSRCRVILMFAWHRGYIWEGLYDIGLRKGEFISITDSAFATYLKDTEEKYLVKRREIAHGIFSLLYKEWNGPLGESLKSEFVKIFPSLDYLCLCYDTVVVVKEAIKYMLNYGEDIENAEKLLYYMRSNKVTGCMGNVYFSKDTTSVSNGKFAINQILSYSNQTLYSREIAYLDKLSTQFIQYVNKPKWETDTAPSNFIPIYDCPFELREIKSSNKGINVLIGLSVFFLIITCVFSFLSYQKFKSTFTVISEKKLMSLSDRAFYLYFFFQFIQFLTMGPDQEAVKNVSNNFGLLLSLDFDKYYNLTQDKFWILFYSVFGFSIFWVLMCLTIVLELDIKYQNLWIFEQISVLCNLIFPLIGSIGFLPILSMLINLFLCTDSVGDSLTDTFMDRDCYVYCYKGKHRSLSVVSVVLIFFHIAFSVYCKPIWELTQDSLAIRTRPSYLSALSILQVILIILNKLLNVHSQFIHGCICTILVFIFLLYTIKTKPYNHQPAFVLQIASLMMSVWGLFTATFFLKISNLSAWIITEFVGFTVIVLVTIIAFAKSDSMLYITKGNDISSLFIFQFCKNYERYAKDLNSLHFSVGTKYRTENIPINKD